MATLIVYTDRQVTDEEVEQLNKKWNGEPYWVTCSVDREEEETDYYITDDDDINGAVLFEGDLGELTEDGLSCPTDLGALLITSMTFKYVMIMEL